MSATGSLLNLLPKQTQERIATRVYERSMPKVRQDARLYAAHGDNMWGNAISHRDSEQLAGHFGLPTGSRLRISGHMSPKPQNGDQLLVKMQSGQWALFVVDKLEHARGVSDMFFAEARGPVRYASPEEVPQSKNASEFLGPRRAGAAKRRELPEGTATAESYTPGELVLLDGAGATIVEHVFDGLLLETDEVVEVAIDNSQLDRVRHIPDSQPVNRGPSSRLSSLAD